MPTLRIRQLLSEEEAELAGAANTGHTGDANEARVTSEVYLSRTIRNESEGLTTTIRDEVARLIDSSDAHASAMRSLTAALVGVGILQVIVLVALSWAERG